MEIKFSNSSERFDNIHFSNEIINGKSLPVFSTYTCPMCKEKIGFTKKDFEERTLKEFSNLSTEHLIMFDKYAKEKQFEKLHFLDWYCPICKLPVRIYVNHWAGGKHGDYGVNIIFVLEGFSEKDYNSANRINSGLSDTIKVYFYFLATDYGFKGPFEYNIAHEMHTYYAKGKILIDFGFDGGYYCFIIQTKEYIKELETGEINPQKIKQDLFMFYDLSLLYDEPLPLVFRTRNITFYKKFREPKQQIREILKLLKNNLELLDGNFIKYSVGYRIKNRFIKGLPNITI